MVSMVNLCPCQSVYTNTVLLDRYGWLFDDFCLYSEFPND